MEALNDTSDGIAMQHGWLWRRGGVAVVDEITYNKLADTN